MWDCDTNYYFINGTCDICYGGGCGVTGGCKNSYDCNLCVNSLCTSCDNYYTCSACIETASLVNGVCTCQSNYYLSFLTTGQPNCTICNETCFSTCTGSSPCDCNSVNFLQKHSVVECCYSSCPAGFIKVNNSCNLVNTTILNLDFNRIEKVSWEDSYKNQIFIAVPGQNYSNNTFSNPIPAYQRGYYFYNNSYANVSEITIFYSFTINL